uniref:Uncharacterized protein n=1 Tax=Plectus sambesii TaxID=2011161 RepID=A0A914V9Q8_9BILA
MGRGGKGKGGNGRPIEVAPIARRDRCGGAGQADALWPAAASPALCNAFSPHAVAARLYVACLSHSSIVFSPLFDQRSRWMTGPQRCRVFAANRRQCELAFARRRARSLLLIACSNCARTIFIICRHI